MPLISTKIHGLLDYAAGISSIASPKLLQDRRAAALLVGSGAGTLAISSLTDYELGIRRRVPMPAHLAADAATGTLLIAAARVLRRRGASLLDCAPLVLVGLAEISAAAMTSRRPGDRPTEAEWSPFTAAGARAGASASAAPPAAVPPETPGPSVTPPQTPAPDTGRTERVDPLPGESEPPASGDALVAREEAAAAAEAARIGGSVAPEVEDPAMKPVYQAGGGEQDGWEAAEAELIENASHGDGRGDPGRDAFTAELESDRSGAVYGEADETPSTEVVEDQAAGTVDGAAGTEDSGDAGQSDRAHAR